MGGYVKTDYLKQYGAITGYGSKYWTPGLDVDLKIGDPVTAPKEGKVTFAGERGGFGNQVEVTDRYGNRTMLSHLSSVGVKVGQDIRVGENVGLGGNSGKTYSPSGGDGSHLDLTIKKKDDKYMTAQQVERYVTTNPESSVLKNKKLNEFIEKARGKGRTDTQILDYLGKRDSDFEGRIEKARQGYRLSSTSIKNDADLLNFVNKKVTGTTLITPSVGDKNIVEQEAERKTMRDKIRAKVATPEKKQGFMNMLKSARPKIGIQKEVQRVKDIASVGKKVFEKAKEPIKKRLGFLQETEEKRKSKEITKPEVILRTAGDIIAGGEEVLGAGVSALFEAKTPEVIKQISSELGQDILNTEAGKKAVTAIATGAEAWGQFKESNPRIAKDIESGLNVATALPLGRGKRIVSKGVETTLEAGEDIAKLAGKNADEISSALSAYGKRATKTVGRAVKVTGGVGKAVDKAGDTAKATSKYFVGQATGLSPDTISLILRSPDNFTKEVMTAVDRTSIAKGVEAKINARLKALSETGSGYGIIRKSKQRVAVGNFLDDVLKKQSNFDIVDGKIIANTKSVTRSSADINAIQKLYDDWAGKTSMNADEYLNFRSDLSDLANFDKIGLGGKTKASEAISKSLRIELNKYRSQIDGLEGIDNSFSAETKILKQIKKDYFDKDGSLKDAAINKIANLTGVGKDKALNRLAEIVPNIESQIRILRAIEDIQHSSGQKVGTYTRAAITGGAAFTGNIPLAVATILSNPSIAVKIIRAFGKSRLHSEKTIKGLISALEEGRELNSEETKLAKALFNLSDDEMSKMLGKIS